MNEAQLSQISRLTPMLICEDVPESMHFFTNVLGFELHNHVKEIGKSGWACLRYGEVELMLASPTFLPAAVQTDGMFPQSIYYFYVSDIQALRERVIEAGYEPSEMRTTEYQKREFDLLDPSGHMLWFGEDLEAE